MNRWWMTAMIMALGLLAARCMDRHRRAQPGPVTPDPRSAIVGIPTRDGVEVKFDGPAAIQGDKLVARVKRKPYETALANIQRYWVETRSLNKAKTIGLAAGVTVAVVGIVVAVAVGYRLRGVKNPRAGAGWGCCLYVYSWDGDRYNFDT